MAIEYDPSENPTTGIPFSNGQEEAGLINKKSEGGAYTNESVGEYATAVSAANNAKQSELNAAESETNAATSATNAASSAAASANSATASADSASSSATSADNAATSETNAATSATNAANSATNASTSETNAATSESNAATSALSAATSETNASTSESNAATSEANAAISETNAANSASASASSATASETSASHAATSESNASTSEDNALASATAAANSASAAAASEANAQASAAAALASEQAAQSSEDDAETAQVAAESAQASAEAAETAAETAQVAAETAQTASESAQTAAESAQASATASANSATASATSAASSAQDAQSSEDDAETSATAAAASASAASSSASAASTSATASATSATQSATSASNAATSASNAATSETNAATSATNAFASETAAATSEANASNSATASANSATASASSAAAALASETAAATSETNAAASELAAATSESNAATSESNAATSETNAATSETNAATSETNASNSATAALASEIAAATSESNASTSETNAAASESAAATSESNASTSATSAANSASAASLSASAASTSETNAASSELAASISETNAATSETNASTSATAAATSATSASTSASSAAGSESAASASELAAATSESNAASSATSAASSATAAAISATSASDSASAAATSETNAETAETNAASSASAAATSETNAANSASAAATSASNASTSETNAEAVKTTLYGIYLGLATEDPTVDLNGQALSGGEFYYNTTTNITRIYNGSSWVNGAVDTSSFVLTNSDATLDSLQLNGGTGTQGTLSWNTDEETVDLILDGATLQLGQEVHYHVRNNTASAIPNGTAVYATGTLGASGRITIAPFLADGNTPAKYFIGITTEEIAAGADGKVTDFGKVRNLDTTGFSEGSVLYPSSTTAGALTTTAPTAPNIAIPCAFVVYSGNNGNIFVRVHPQDENAYATYSQGALADTAVQPGDNVSDLTNDASYATTSYVDTAESDAVSTANAYTDTRETAITTAYESYTDTAISNLVDTAPTTLDTLNELAAALGDDPNFASTVTTSLGTKADKTTSVSAGTALTGGGDLSANRTISHSNVTRTNTTDSGTLSHSGTFTAITGLTSNAQGHVTGAETTTYTLPAGAVPNDATITIEAGTDLSTGGAFTTDQGVNETITLNHSSVTRSNTTSSSSPAHGGTFTTIDSVTTSSTGHITGVNTKTVTLPADNNTWRPIHDSPVDGATTTSISSNWAYDNVKTAVPSDAVFTDTVYTHPTYNGDDFSVDTGPLTGATVVSDIDINVTTDGLGHVTDANGVVSTRTLTLGDLGYTGATDANKYVHPTHPGDDINLDTGPLTGATVISDLDFNVTTDTLGHVTDANATYSTRNLTYSDVGAAAASHSHSYLPLTGGTVNGNIFLNDSGDSVIQKLSTTSNYGAAVKWYKGGVSQSTYDPQIGQHNTGGTGTGAITILPYPTTTNPWGGAVGLYLSEAVIKYKNQNIFHDGYHPNADKWTTARTLSLSGDASGSVSWDGSANATLSVTVNDDSHNHTIANIDGLQTALDGKAAASHSHSYIPLSGGNYSGTLTYTGSGVAVNTGGDNIDMGTMTIVGSNGVNGWASKPGIKLDSANDFRIHASSGDATLYVDGDIYAGAGAATQKVFHDGYHPNADKWTTARTLSLTGDVTGSVSWDGSGNASMTTTVANDSHNHDHSDGNFTVNGDIYGKSVNGAYSNLYRMGGVYFTWDSDSYGTNTNHSIRSTYGDTYSDDITINSYNRVRINLDSNGNNSNEEFTIGYHTTGTANTLFRVNPDYAYHVSDMRAPIFYDSNDTGYYLDPANSGTAMKLRGRIILEQGNTTAGGIELNSVKDSTWPFEFTTNDVGNDNESGFWVGSNGYPDMRLRRDNGTVRALISSWEQSYVSNGFRVEGTTDLNGNLYVGTGTSSNIYMADSDHGQRRIHCNSNRIGFLNEANAWGSYCGDGGDWFSDQSVRAPIFYDSGNTGFYWDPNSSGAHKFQTSSGYVHIGPMNTSHCHFNTDRGNFYFNTNIRVNSGLIDSYDEDLHLRRASSDSNKLVVYSGYSYATGSMRSPIFYDGNNTAYYADFSSTGTSINIAGILVEASDAKLKTNLERIPDALNKVKQLNGYTYDRIDNNMERQAGVIAQEVEAVLPEVVRQSGDHKSVSYGNMVSLLIEAIKEQQEQIDDLKSKINSLEGN